MRFTQEDFRKIEDWLYNRAIKDTQFPEADPLKGNELIPIVQDNRNRNITIRDLTEKIAMLRLPDFFNVTVYSKQDNLCLGQAINLVPVEQRKLGLTITFCNEKGHWLIYQFRGTSLYQWDSLNYWKSPLEEALEEYMMFPDEEDITAVEKDNKIYLKFKDKEYNPEVFSGTGKVILRKNIRGTEACNIDDEDHLINVLTQGMVNKENTIYIVQYDFDLNGKSVIIPEGCTLWFQGGSINNGTVYLSDTAVLGAFEFADMGNATLSGTFNKGQVMTFLNEDRQELRWWNGEEWILILDITDYNEIRSIINNLIDKHNAEMAACYKYIDNKISIVNDRISDAEKRIDSAESNIANHEGRITKNESDIASLNSDVDTINGKIDTINDDITSINGDIDGIKDNISDIEDSIGNLNDVTGSNSDRITNLEGTTSNIEGDITTIQNNITTIQNNVTTAQSDITNINSSITNINSNINDIQDSVTNLGNTISGIPDLIDNKIEEYLKDFVSGVQTITVNDVVYSAEDGNITLPDYPEIETIKDVVTSPTIIQYIVNYLNKKTLKCGLNLRALGSYYVVPESSKVMSAKTFITYYKEEWFGEDVLVDEDTLNTIEVLDSNGEVLNLCTVGFSNSWLSEGETGIVYSEDESYFDNLTLDKFLSITNNTAALGKLQFEKIATAEEDINGNKVSVEIIDTEKVNSALLDTRNKFYKGYIYIPTRGIFYTTIEARTFSGERVKNNFGPINYNSIINYGIGDPSVRRYVKFSKPSLDIENKRIEFTMELENLYVIDSSRAEAYTTSADANNFEHIKKEQNFSKPGALIPGVSTIGVSNKGSIEKLSDNKYKVSMPETYVGSSGAAILVVPRAKLAYSESNIDSPFEIVSNTYYILDRSTKETTIEEITTASLRLLE